jgi:hypothetical protein
MRHKKAPGTGGGLTTATALASQITQTPAPGCPGASPSGWRGPGIRREDSQEHLGLQTLLSEPTLIAGLAHGRDQ